MASIGDIIFWSMIVLIFACAGFLILLLIVAFSASQGTVETNVPFPVGNLGQDVVLQCKFISKNTNLVSGDVSITWEKQGLTGLVYQFKNNKEELQQQNSAFKNRVQLFSELISAGNASLLLRSVRTEDEGVYHCSVKAPGVSGTTSVHLRVGVYTAPTITKISTTLRAEAQRWRPKPNVTWTNQNQEQLSSTTLFTSMSEGIVGVESDLKGPVNSSERYTCIIQNILIKSVTEATGDGVLIRSYFITNSSLKLLPVQLLFTAPLLLSLLTW